MCNLGFSVTLSIYKLTSTHHYHFVTYNWITAKTEPCFYVLAHIFVLGARSFTDPLLVNLIFIVHSLCYLNLSIITDLIEYLGALFMSKLSLWNFCDILPLPIPHHSTVSEAVLCVCWKL